MATAGPASLGDRLAAWPPLDSEAVAAAVAAMPDHIEAVLEAPPERAPGFARGAIRAVAVAGMGGSGVAGRVLQALAGRTASVPVVCANGYEIPAFVGAGSVVVAVSFSGGTEETLEVARTALERKAELRVITSGGELESLAVAAGAPVYKIAPGIPQPRAAVGAITAPLLMLAGELGLVPDAASALRSAAEQLRRRVAECRGGGGVAEQIASAIGRTIPLVHGAVGLGQVAAERFKTQVNENAKAPCFAGVEPEVCHNEICGFGQHGDVTRQLLTLVTIRLGDEHPRIARRFGLFFELAGEALARSVEVRAEGGTSLARFFDAVVIGDYVSLHLADREGVDPGPVPVLAEVKRRLGGR